MKFRDDRQDRPFRDPEEREKKSWRDLDRARDRSAHLSKEHTQPDRPKSFEVRRNESLAKQALEQLFQGKKSKQQEDEWKKVIEGATKNFSTRASKYVEKHGLPNEWDDLLRLLDHREVAFVESVLQKMMERAPNETASKRDLLVGKLRILRVEREEPALLGKIEEYVTTLAAQS